MKKRNKTEREKPEKMEVPVTSEDALPLTYLPSLKPVTS